MLHNPQPTPNKQYSNIINTRGVADCPVEQGTRAQERTTSNSPAQMTNGSEGYPSWLPKRPDPPPPGSTLHSSMGIEPASPGAYSDSFMSPILGGRQPTPRSIRIVSVGEEETFSHRGQRQPSDHTRVASSLFPRGSKGVVTPGLSPTAISGAPGSDAHSFLPSRIPQPRFRTRGINFNILRNPSIISHLYFYLFPILTFAHIPLQTFLDFNSVYTMIQVSRFPDPDAPGVPGSGRNWAFGVAAYAACWLVWIVIVFIAYEVIYSFFRRWRTKRPSIFPIYTSTSARNLTSMTSYTTFSFLQHIRLSAFMPSRGGSLRDGLAETFYFYSQNLPTVSLLLPRAGLSLALLLAFWTPNPNVLALVGQGSSTGRDGTFFNRDGTLTAYARGVLATNVAWTIWRALVLLISWIGLWVLSGQACAGICGPRNRWEEDDLDEKNRASLYSLNDKNIATPYYDPDAPLPWSWKEGTQSRIWDAYNFCSILKRRSGQTLRDGAPRLPYPESPGGFEGIERLMAGVGLTPASPSSPPKHRRGVLSEELYRRPEQPIPSRSGSRVKSSPPGTAVPLDLSAALPQVAKLSTKDKHVPPSPQSAGPLKELPYPFLARGTARLSSDDKIGGKEILKVPFPPSRSTSDDVKSPSRSNSHVGADQGEEEEEEEEEQETEEETEETGMGTSSGDPSSSSARASTSMSSLGRPIPSRYPFHFNLPGDSFSHRTPPSNGRSITSRVSQNTHSTHFSRSTASTGNRESTDYSPRSQYTSSDAASPMSAMGPRGLPMPPRHERAGARARAGTVPAASSSSSPSVDFPRSGRQRAHTRGVSAGRSIEVTGHGFGPYGMSSSEAGSEWEEGDEDEFDDSMMMEQPEPEGSQEEDEGDDVVALLSSSRAQSPRTSLRRRAGSTASLTHRRAFSLSGASGSGSGSGGSSVSGSRSGSNSRTHSGSGSSSGRSRAGTTSGPVRSRTQSLLQTVSSASRSSLEMVQSTITRTRSNSTMARLDDNYTERTHSRSGSASDAMSSSITSGENNTFGHPIRRRERMLYEEDEAPSSHSHTPGAPEIREPSPYPRETSRPSLREARSDLSGNAPSLRPSESSTVRGHELDALEPPSPSAALTVPEQRS
ncbi:hypothetical protein PQX77_016934 [Marasmius sp. AFHP31]|nr:hypothetical protein PQX77_016934 [Marasmius sp. AFHP31]